MTLKKNAVRKTEFRQKAQLMSRSEIERTLVRLAHEILEKNGGVDGLGLVGIRRRGVPIAERLGKEMQQGAKKKKKFPWARSISRFIVMTFPHSAPNPWCRKWKSAFPSRARRSSWSTTCFTPAAPRALLSTPFFPMAARAWCSC